MSKAKPRAVVPLEHIVQSILILRGQRVLLDSELANLYGVTTKRFNEQVKRNLTRFPADFMFQLSLEERPRPASEISALRLYRTRRHHGCDDSQRPIGFTANFDD